ncbi:hypothetical protein [Mycoplasma sp. Ms02]|uniref:hypothetical protein n=1 Tax=Mycoplasma sp. Ms02 TaxID=353851 RepID=UPI001C8A0F46|nr:hypothetical protein [Mycoplasma sp. Ms02]QZE12530.1 hypothetical protein K4L35_00880 [Mycoplasma sp. Ms02]
MKSTKKSLLKISIVPVFSSVLIFSLSVFFTLFESDWFYENIHIWIFIIFGNITFLILKWWLYGIYFFAVRQETEKLVTTENSRFEPNLQYIPKEYVTNEGQKAIYSFSFFDLSFSLKTFDSYKKKQFKKDILLIYLFISEKTDYSLGEDNHSLLLLKYKELLEEEQK